MLGIQLKTVLLIGQLPPPIHGVSIMNSIVVNSEVIRRRFNIVVVNLQFAKSIKDVANFSLFKVFQTLFYGFEIVKKVLTNKPDLIYFTIAPTGYAFYRDAFYVSLLKILNIKIVFHLHGKGIKETIKSNYIKKHLYKWVFRNTYIICLSKSLTYDIREVYKSIPFIVPNGIQMAQKFTREINKLSESVPNILYLSNFKYDKGVLVLIEALSLLKSQGYSFEANLIGAPFDISIGLLENLIRSKNLEKFVKVIGPLYNENKAVEFRKADIFVLPTFNDAFPLVILEAMQYSLPIVSTIEGGIPEIVINNETGLLVEARNDLLLAEKIATLLMDKDLRIKFGENGYKRFINNFTLNHFENNMNKTFQNIFGF